MNANQLVGGTPAPASAKTDRGVADLNGLDQPDRNRPVHLPNIERPNQPVILFVTVCTKERRPILATDQVHAVLIRVWPQAEQYRVGRYVIMPDHIHLFCAPTSCKPENVKLWVAFWKRLATIELRELRPIWQRDCWDTQLRQVHHYSGKWQYVVGNPVRKGLVDAPEQWPFQGCLNELGW
jgi:putative transposase